MQRIENGGVAYGAVKAFLKDKLPTTIEERERDDLAYQLVPKALTEIFGSRNEAWYSYKNERRNTIYVKAGRNPERGESRRKAKRHLPILHDVSDGFPARSPS